jgi:hypothetical protein
MSQELTPLPNSSGIVGLTPTIVTTIQQPRFKAYSPEYKEVKKLFLQPTQWVPGGRPIYRRLPAASETYQVDFFADGSVGYVYIPLGNDQFGGGSLYVNQSENLDALLIEDGVIVWEEGTTPVFKTIVDFREIGLESGRFLVCYQLLYDDAPEPLPFLVTDYSLAGLDFSVQDSASYVFLSSGEPNGNAWPHPGTNAFLPSSSDLSWKNFLDPVNRTPQATSGVIPGIPTEYQPLLCWLEWSSPYPWKLNVITMRCPLEGKLPEATLSYKDTNGDWYFVQSTDARYDTNGAYYQFTTDTAPQTAWRVEWPSETKIEIEDITVSGVLTLLSKPSTERARAQLAIYPTNLVPKDETLCRLAIINVNSFELQRNDRGEILKEDIRNIATRDYEPVADWLTEFWDEQLIRGQEKVAAYSPVFMAPPTLLRTSYFDLEKYGVDITYEPPPFPPSPPRPTEVNLISVSVSLYPTLPTSNSLASATVSFSNP